MGLGFFSFLHNIFLLCQKSDIIFWAMFYLLCTNAFNMHLSKMLGNNGLTHSHTTTPFEAPGKQAF